MRQCLHTCISNQGRFLNLSRSITDSKPPTMQKNIIDFESLSYLSLPPEIKNSFKKLIHIRKEVSLPSINEDDNHSTVALLSINNREFPGINKKTAGISSKM